MFELTLTEIIWGCATCLLIIGILAYSYLVEKLR